MIALALRHAQAHWGRSLLLIGCVFIIAALPLISRSVAGSFERVLRDRAETVPLLVGAAGSRFDLVLAALHWRVSNVAPIELGVVDEIATEPGVRAFPVHARFTAKGEPIAAVPFEYFDFRSLAPREGRLVSQLGEAVLGSSAAARLGLASGDRLPSDQRRSYDITGASSVVLQVVGVLAETGTPDDEAVLVDLETAWLLEGIAHGHEPASSITDPSKLIGRSRDRVALSGAVIEHQRVDAHTADSFHMHGERDRLPITAVLVVPPTDKAATLVRTRINANTARQAISPSKVSKELIESVLRIQRLIDAVSLVVGLAMLCLLALVVTLSVRARANEIRTLRDIGASRAQIVQLFAIEFGGLAAAGVLAATLTAWGAADLAPRMMMWFT
ncbi:MAG: FtsX-like permease family protein [Planctomycetota bacterium]